MSKRNRHERITTRPDNAVATPQPQGIVEREIEAQHPGWQLCYPCPLCHGSAGGICNVVSSREFVVYVKCDTCTFSGPMAKRDGRLAAIRPRS